MPIDKSIQEKVLKIASNKAVDTKVKLAVRKQFYVLKQLELDIEGQQDELNTKVNELDGVLNQILIQLNDIPEVNTVDNIPAAKIIAPQKKAPIVMDDDSEEEIIMPSTNKQMAGIKVRMQEEVTDAEDGTDFEVPFEAEEK